MNRLISKDPDDICTLEYPNGVQIASYADNIVIMSNHIDRNTLIQQALTTFDQRLNVWDILLAGSVMSHISHCKVAALKGYHHKNI